jgi:hypothetical protein
MHPIMAQILGTAFGHEVVSGKDAEREQREHEDAILSENDCRREMTCHESCRAAGHPCLGDGDYQDVDR